MSDRFVLDTTKKNVEQLFNVSTERDDFFTPEFNISPGSLIPVVYKNEGERKIYNFVWGLIPEDAKAETDGRENFEVVLEEIGGDSWYGKCLAQRRCLIPANGFYKWKTSEKQNTPFYIRLLSNELTAFAGIFSVWKSDSGRDVYSCAILTTEANALVQPVGDRMPLLLHPDDYEKWLSDENFSKEKISDLKGYGLTDLAVNRVSEDVNDPTNNSAELIQPIPK